MVEIFARPDDGAEIRASDIAAHDAALAHRQAVVSGEMAAAAIALLVVVMLGRRWLRRLTAEPVRLRDPPR